MAATGTTTSEGVAECAVATTPSSETGTDLDFLPRKERGTSDACLSLTPITKTVVVVVLGAVVGRTCYFTCDMTTTSRRRHHGHFLDRFVRSETKQR